MSFCPGCDSAAHRSSRQKYGTGELSAVPSRHRSWRHTPPRHPGQRNRDRHCYLKQIERAGIGPRVRWCDAELRLPGRHDAPSGGRAVWPLRDDQFPAKTPTLNHEAASTQLQLRGRVQVRISLTSNMQLGFCH